MFSNKDLKNLIIPLIQVTRGNEKQRKVMKKGIQEVTISIHLYKINK